MTSELVLRIYALTMFGIKSQIPPDLPKSERDLLKGECRAYYILRDKYKLSKSKIVDESLQLLHYPKMGKPQPL
jgi:hypothetical protein